MLHIYSPSKPKNETIDSVETLAWNIPISDCGIESKAAPESDPGQLLREIYINPPEKSALVMHQVTITCKQETFIDERIVSELIFFWALNHIP